MTLTELLATLAAQRAALRRKITPEAAHAFARTVDAVGYYDARHITQAHTTLAELVGEVRHYYDVVLKREPKDAAAINDPRGVHLQPRRPAARPPLLRPGRATRRPGTGTFTRISGSPTS